uniref:TMC domain-containing protein n=1 Tax=Dendroctonus ponderosae TaxID=77166 RepID=A0AAR5QI69_DENPD
MQQQSLQHQQDRVQFPEQPVIDGNESDEDDYSASVNAIIQRRASTRRSKKQSRRASSPFLSETPAPDRRRSSVFTTSSGDTAITVEDENAANEVTQDEIFENIKLHKEVLSNVKMQPWNMRKKLKLVLQAKSYIKKHEGQLQERLAQSHSTKDMLARWNIVVIKKWQKWKREITNMSMWFIPWELKIKEIESHFGSVVASYFIFLRWLFWVNIVIAVVIISFVTIPEIITADTEAEKDRKFVLPEEKYNSTNFLTLWDFEGVFKYSPLFYGWYTNRDYNDSTVLTTSDGKISHGRGYRLPFAYFVTGLVVYAYSFFAILRKMAENSRMSKLSEKDDECIFSWKLFTAWDYMIGNAETAHNRVASIVMGFKEALLEEAEKKRESRNWKVICFRVLVNSLVAGLLSCSAFAVIVVVKRSTEPDADSTVWRKNEITVVMTLITLSFPMLFEVLGFAEQYHPRKQLRLQLARIMVLNLLNLYSLIFALFDKISDMTILLQEIKTNLNESMTSSTTVSSISITSISYGEIENRKIRNYTLNAKLRSLCWETMFGQELIKLTVMDLIVTGLSILMMDFFRGIFVRFMNRCWCWDLEKNFPQYGDFKVAENILHLVNNQGMVWMGMFFSPGLVVLNVIKLFILMYLRTWAVLTCNVPHEIIFRASRSNNFYYGLLLMMLFLCVLPVGYAIVWIEPSWHCGPFSDYQKIFHIFTKTIRANVPESMHRALDYIASPGIVIPLLLLLVLIIYYLVSLTGALREANNDLKTQLRRERTEERRKMFQLADRRRRGGSGESADQTPFSKWKKILGNLPNTQSCDDTRQESDDIVPSQRDDYEEEEAEEEIEKVENRGKGVHILKCPFPGPKMLVL